MRFIQCAVTVLAATVLSVSALAADTGAPAQKPDTNNPAANAKTFRGTLTAKPPTAGADIVATLVVKGHKAKDAAPDAPKPETKNYSVSATGNVAAQIAKLDGKRVEITGTEANGVITATAVKELVKKNSGAGADTPNNTTDAPK